MASKLEWSHTGLPLTGPGVPSVGYHTTSDQTGNAHAVIYKYPEGEWIAQVNWRDGRPGILARFQELEQAKAWCETTIEANE